MRDRDGGAWGGLQVSGTGHLPASVAVWKDGFRTQWQARRAPPEAVPVGKRRDPPVPLTGITGNGQGARQPETEPPGHHGDSRAASQWMRGSGVPPVLVVRGVGNEWGGSVTRFLRTLCIEGDPVRMGKCLCVGSFPRAHALVV